MASARRLVSGFYLVSRLQNELDWAIARSYRSQGNPELAARYFERAINGLELTEDRTQLGLAHLAAATVLMDDERLDQAEKHLDRAEQMLSCSSELAHATGERARLALLNGDHAQARSLAQQALARLEHVNGRADETGRAWTTLAEVYAALQQHELADTAFRTAISKLAKRAPARTLAYAYQAYAAYLETRGRPSDALDALKHAADLLNTPGGQ